MCGSGVPVVGGGAGLLQLFNDGHRADILDSIFVTTVFKTSEFFL